MCVSTDQVNDHATVAPPARRLAEVGHAVRRMRAGEHIQLRRVVAADDADVAGFGNWISEAEHGIISSGSWNATGASSTTAATGDDQCDQEKRKGWARDAAKETHVLTNSYARSLTGGGDTYIILYI